MMTNEEFWDQALVDLLAEMPDVTFEVVQLPDQKPHAHMVDRPDIEIVPVDSDPQTGRNYDAWQRPIDPSLNPFAVDQSQVLTDMAPSPVMLSMNLGETVNWLNLQLLMTPSGQLRSTATEPPPLPPPA